MDRTATRTARWLLTLTLTLTLVGPWGCFGERRGLSRDALERSLTEPLAARARVAPKHPCHPAWWRGPAATTTSC